MMHRSFLLLPAALVSSLLAACLPVVEGPDPDFVPVEVDGTLAQASVGGEPCIALSTSMEFWAIYEDVETGERVDVIEGGVFRVEQDGQAFEDVVSPGGSQGFAMARVTPNAVGSWTITFDVDGPGPVDPVSLGDLVVAEAVSISPITTNWGWGHDTVWSTPARLELIGGVSHYGFAQLVDGNGNPLGGSAEAALVGALGPIPEGEPVYLSDGQTGVTQPFTDLDGVFAVELPNGQIVPGTEFVNHPLDALDGYDLNFDVSGETLTLTLTALDGAEVSLGNGWDGPKTALNDSRWIATVDGDAMGDDVAPEGWILRLSPTGPEHVVRFEIGALAEDVTVRGDLEIIYD